MFSDSCTYTSWGMCGAIFMGDTMFKTTMAAVFSIALSTFSAQAALVGDPAVISIVNPTAGLSGSAQTRGWRFTANSDFEITALGVADRDDTNGIGATGDAPGFGTPKQVNLWNSVGAIIASVTLPAGTGAAVGPGTINTGVGTDSGVFRYSALQEAISIATGQTYTISVFYQQFSNDYAFGSPIQGSVSYDPRFTRGTLLFDSATTHVLPGQGFSGTLNAGPTFLIAPATAEVPLPFSIALLGAGLGALGLRRRRKAA
jgi:hypothetical protein